jgi:hypothetical protein
MLAADVVAVGDRLDEGRSERSLISGKFSRSALNWETAWHSALRSTLVAIIVVYTGWNGYWLAQGRLAPSLLLSATGVPAPTTGGTSAIVALAQGNLVESVRCNAMAVPMALLFIGSLGILAARALQRKSLHLPVRLGWAWAAVLLIAWIVKLLVN